MSKTPKIPKGWRELSANERVQKGDKFKSPFGGGFMPSNNWREGDHRQDSLFRPYIRRIAKKGGKRK